MIGEVVLQSLVIDKMAGKREYDYQSAFAIGSSCFIYIIVAFMILSFCNCKETYYGRYNNSGYTTPCEEFCFNKRVKDYDRNRDDCKCKVVWHTPKREEEIIIAETTENPTWISYIYFIFTFVISALHYSDRLDKIVDKDKQLWLVTATNCITITIHLIHDRIGGRICFWNSCIREEDVNILHCKSAWNKLLSIFFFIALLII